MAQFYQTAGEPNDLVVCPYDEAHLVRQKRLPYHLMKCRKNHPNKRMVSCHFNARHEIPEADLRHHLANCPDRNIVERYNLYASSSSNNSWKNKGNTDVPTYFPDVLIPETENWDEEITAQPRIGVHPRDLAGIGYMKSTQGMKPAQKKQFYANLKNDDYEANVQLMDSFNANHELDRGEPQKLARGEPQKAPTAMTGVSQTNSTQQIPAVARGRGRGLNLAQMAVAPHGLTADTAATCGRPDSTIPSTRTEQRSKEIKKLKKKMQQIEILLERQKNNEVLTRDEKTKIALKMTVLTDLERLKKEAQLEWEQQQM